MSEHANLSFVCVKDLCSKAFCVHAIHSIFWPSTMQKGRSGKILPSAHVGFGILVLTSGVLCHWPGQVFKPPGRSPIPIPIEFSLVTGFL